MRTYVVHLRPHFQLMLAPIFLWGYLWAGGGPDLRLLIGFVVVHLFLYGGITAYNSAYDHDRGPVGGLYRPPRVGDGLLPFSILVQLAGLALATALGWQFSLIYLAIMALSVAYSHPRIRWKASPVASSLVVFGGQGLLGFLAGWLAAGGSFASSLGVTGLGGALAAAGVTLGMYPLGQLFQLREDAQRGDRTLALALGPERAFRFVQVSLALGGAIAALMVARRWGLAEAAVVGLPLAAVVGVVDLWRSSFDPEAVRQTYVRVMSLQAALSGGLIAYVAWKLS